MHIVQPYFVYLGCLLIVDGLVFLAISIRLVRKPTPQSWWRVPFFLPVAAFAFFVGGALISRSLDAHQLSPHTIVVLRFAFGIFVATILLAGVNLWFGSRRQREGIQKLK
jgi:hypothetical protein